MPNWTYSSDRELQLQNGSADYAHDAGAFLMWLRRQTGAASMTAA